MKAVVTSSEIPRLLLKVENREYTVAFPLSAVVKAEEKIGRSLKGFLDWLNVPTKDIPALLEAGLSKHHPDIKPEDITAICDRLNPEALDEVQYALCSLAFPQTMARLETSRLSPKEQSEGTPVNG